MGLSIPGVCKVPYTCGMVYIGQTHHTILEKIAEHAGYILLKQPEKSVLAEHCLSTIDSACILSKV